MTERLRVLWTSPAGRRRAGLWPALSAALGWKGLFQSRAPTESHLSASIFPLPAAGMGYVLSNMPANWGGAGGEWERKEGREKVYTLVLINLDIFFNLAAWHFPMLKVRSWLIFSYLLFCYTEALLSANNCLQYISFSKINITQLIYKQHDAFKLRDGRQGLQARAVAKTCLTPCDCFADPRSRFSTFLTQPHYQPTDSNAHQVCLCLLHPNPRASGLPDRGGRRCAGSLCTE